MWEKTKKAKKTAILFYFLYSVFILSSFQAQTISSTATSTSPKISSKIYPNTVIDSTIQGDKQYIKEIEPYKNKLDSTMNVPITYAQEDYTKQGYSSNETNLIADLTLDYSRKYAKKNKLPLPEFCLLNYGGVRTMIPKGVVTLRNIFEVSPFENQLVFLQLDGQQMKEMFDYLLKEKIGHPLSGIKIEYKKNRLRSAYIQDKPFDPNKKYWMVTIDYLRTGGDRMFFFSRSEKSYVPDTKLREVLIQQMKNYKILPNKKDQRLIFAD